MVITHQNLLHKKAKAKNTQVIIIILICIGQNKLSKLGIILKIPLFLFLAKCGN
jgi:hypothetical protein